MAVSLVFMILALLTGIFRLMSDNGLVTGVLSSLYTFHPIIMVFGFLASIVMTERVAGLSVIPGLNKSSNIASAMVPLTVLGVVAELIGYTLSISQVRYLGGGLLFAGSVSFIYVLLCLSGKTGIKLPFFYMILSVVSLTVSAILSAFELPLGQNGFIMLLLSFPIIFILGERVELTRFTWKAASKLRFKVALGVASISVALFAFGSLPLEQDVHEYFVSIGSASLFLAFLLILLAENQNFKLLAKSPLPLQRYVSTHTRLAYTWGMVGMVLAEFYIFRPSSFDFYDPFIHSLAVGFIGTMLLAHGPVILPSIAGRKIQIGKFALVPLILLTVGNCVRIAGDIMLEVIPGQVASYVLRAVVGLSGWFILAAVLIFLGRMLISNNKGTTLASTSAVGTMRGSEKNSRPKSSLAKSP